MLNTTRMLGVILMAAVPLDAMAVPKAACFTRVFEQVLREKAANQHLLRMQRLDSWSRLFQSLSRSPASVQDLRMSELRAFIHHHLRLGSYEPIYNRLKIPVKTVFASYQRIIDIEALSKKLLQQWTRFADESATPSQELWKELIYYAKAYGIERELLALPASSRHGRRILEATIEKMGVEKLYHSKNFARAIDTYVAGMGTLHGIFLQNSAAESAKTLSEIKALLRRGGVHAIDESVDISRLSAEAQLAYGLLKKFQLKYVMDDYYIAVGKAAPAKTPLPHEFLTFMDERPMIDYYRLRYATISQGISTAGSWLPTEVIQSGLDRILARIPWIDRSRVRKVFRVALDQQMRLLYFADIDRIAASTAPIAENVLAMRVLNEGSQGEFLLTFARRIDLESQWTALRNEAQRLAETSAGVEKERYAKFLADMRRAEVEASKLDGMALHANTGRFHFIARVSEVGAAAAVFYVTQAYLGREGGAVDQVRGALEGKSPEEILEIRDALLKEDAEHEVQLQEIEKILSDLERDPTVRAEIDRAR